MVCITLKDVFKNSFLWGYCAYISDGFFSLFIGDQWPELLGVLFHASQSPDNAGLRETAFRIFSTTPGIIEKQHEDAVLGVFGKGLKDDEVSVSLLLAGGLIPVSLTDAIAGAHRIHGGLCRILPFYLQEVSAQVLLSYSRSTQRLAPSEGIIGQRRTVLGLGGVD